MAHPDTPLHDEKAPSNEWPDLRFLALSEVVRRVALSRRTVYNLVDSGDFPKPVNLTARRIAFVEAEVIQWQKDRIAGRAA